MIGFLNQTLRAVIDRTRPKAFQLLKISDHLDGIELQIASWRAAPFAVSQVHSTFFEDRTIFPEGSIQFDHGLIMRELLHQWHSVPDYPL